MGVINQLSFEVANLIAAGEVVDRPASAIKELMENAIDAGAKHITVETKNGGVTFMRVSDDGCGMDGEDLPMAIRRHATSKISSAEDLDGICTLGFRGEALAAISSVSKMRLISKKATEPMGAVLCVDHGEIISLNEQGCSNGTTVIAEELFANVPARRKFLKRDITETSFICTNVEKVALSHPEIAIRLICDGQIRLDSAGDGDLKNTIYSIFGKDFASKLIEVRSDLDGITVRGYIGRSDNVKGNRGAENFYINGRYVKSKTATAALEQAYSSYMPSERFPVCVLFIDMSPGRVDVNVHPAKLEVKFSNEKPVFEAVYYAVKQALESNATRPQMQMEKKRNDKISFSEMQAPVESSREDHKQLSIDIGGAINTGENERPKPHGGFSHLTAEEYVSQYVSRDAKRYDRQGVGAYSVKDSADRNVAVKNIEFKSDADTADFSSTYSKASITEKEAHVPDRKAETATSVLSDDTYDLEDKDISSEIPTAQSPVSDTKPKSEICNADTDAENDAASSRPTWRFIGEAFNSYLICEVDDKLLLIDKHAAHERIIFESLRSNMKNKGDMSQILLVPIEVMLMSDEVTCIEEYREELESIGFGFQTSRNTVYVNEIPVGIEASDVPSMMSVFAERLKEGTGNVQITKNIIFEKALYQASCKAAVKAGREYPEEHHKWIINKLMEIPDITFCPHGRPVAMELSHKNIDRQFERT